MSISEYIADISPILCFLINTLFHLVKMRIFPDNGYPVVLCGSVCEFKCRHGRACALCVGVCGSSSVGMSVHVYTLCESVCWPSGALLRTDLT